MDAGEGNGSRAVPAEVYASRLRELKGLQSAERRRERALGYAKLAVAAVTLVAALLLLHLLKALEFLLIPVAVFLILAVLQEKLIRRLRFRARAIAFYQRGLARLNDRWAGSGESGERFLDPKHPYARDLDLFGAGSLFELLSTARTRSGEETLAAWLLRAAPADEVLGRQEAVRDLEGRVGFRERLYCLGETVRQGVHSEPLAAWGERGPVFADRATRVGTRVLAIVWLLSLVAWGMWGFSDLAGAVTVLCVAWAHRLHKRLEPAADALERAADDLELLSGVLGLLEREPFRAAKLTGLQAALKHDGR